MADTNSDDVPSDSVLEEIVRERDGSKARAMKWTLGTSLAVLAVWFAASWLLGGLSTPFAAVGAWLLGNVAALGFARTGGAAAKTGLCFALVFLLVGGYWVDRMTRPELVDPLAEFSPSELWVIAAEGGFESEQLRRMYGVGKKQWSRYSEAERDAIGASLMKRVEAAVAGADVPPVLSYFDFLTLRVLRPPAFLVFGLALALAWRAGSGGDLSSVVWAIERAQRKRAAA